jgi:hypothetical protein
MTWPEDRATQRCDPSAAPGAEVEERRGQRAAASLLFLFDLGAKAINLRGSAATENPSFTYALTTKVHFTLNQYKP